MLELIPCMVGALVSMAFATQLRLASRIVVAALSGVIVAIVSGEAATWPPAIALDAMLAALSCAAVALIRQRVMLATSNRRAIAGVAPTE